MVHEKPGVRSAIGGVSIPGVPGTVARPVGRLRSKLMFLPIVSFADGYGFTYGGRVSTVDLFGIGERLSVPLTWGGTRRAALEFERPFKSGPLTRVDSSLAIWNRENPRFEIRDQRVEVKGRAERVFADVLRARRRRQPQHHQLRRARRRPVDARHRRSASTPASIRYSLATPSSSTAGWTGMHFRTLPDRVNRYTADARGYLRVFRQVVVAGRAAYAGADASLPPYERLLLGGVFVGPRVSHRRVRRRSHASRRRVEVRAPITSVLNGAKLGVTVFIDAGKVWNFGSSMKDAEWHRGVGGGVFLIASVMTHQSRCRPRPEDRRHARALLVGVFFLTRSSIPKLPAPNPNHS